MDREEVARLPTVIRLLVTKSCFTHVIASSFWNKLLKYTVSLEKETKYDIWKRKNYFFLEETKMEKD